MATSEQNKATELHSLFKFLEDQRKYWDQGIWQDIADYIVPLREDMQGKDTPGTIRGTNIYDGTAVSAVRLAADGLHGYMISPSLQWFVLRLPRSLKFLEDEPDVRQWLQDSQETLYDTFQNSNFYEEMNNFFEDGISIGTATMYCEENIAEARQVYTTLHPREAYIAENKYNKVDTVFRKVKLTAKQAKEMFGEDKLSEKLKTALRSNPYRLSEFIHAVFPREDYDDRKIVSTKKRYASVWMEYKGNKILRESGYDLFPYRVWRYSKDSGEVYGRSPAAFALPEIKALNAISKDLLGAAQMAVRPPYNIPIEMKGKVRLVPFGMNYYGSDHNRRISPVNTGVNFPVGLDREEKKQEIIEKHFNVDFFLMLQRADRQMTATEIMERMGEKASVLAARIGDLTAVLDDVIDYSFYKETQAGRMPEIPDALAPYAGSNLNVVYMGPLAQAQRRLFETQGIRTGIELAAPILQIFPEALDIINADETIRELLVSNGFPQSAINSPEIVRSIRENKARASQELTEKDDQVRMAEVLKDLAQADKNSGGKLSEMMQQLVGRGTV